MGFLHRDEPVADATVNCPRCRAIDWVVRTSRLGGQGRIVCRACGHVHGPYADVSTAGDAPPPRPPRVAFPYYVPDGLPWQHAGGWEQAVSVTVEEPWVAVTTEARAHASEVAEALRDGLMDCLSDDDPAGSGRSPAAWLLAVEQEDARLEALVGDLYVENGALRVDGEDVPAKVMRTGGAWAAYAELEEVVVIASSAAVEMAALELVRAR